MSDRIHQEVVLKGSPERVYKALTDASQFSELTGGAPAEISADAGGAFSCFGGMIVGRTGGWHKMYWEPLQNYLA